MQSQQRVNITEQKPSKFIELADGYEVLSNDSTIKIVLHKVTVMDGAMDSTFYSTRMWIDEGNGWLSVGNTQNYRTKEEFIGKIRESEDFTQAARDYEDSLT